MLLCIIKNGLYAIWKWFWVYFLKKKKQGRLEQPPGARAVRVGGALRLEGAWRG